MVSERIQRRISILLDEADEAFAQRNWDVVQQRAQDTLALDPKNQDALTFVAAAERALGTSVLASNIPTPDTSPTTAQPSARTTLPHSTPSPSSVMSNEPDQQRVNQTNCNPKKSSSILNKTSATSRDNPSRPHTRSSKGTLSRVQTSPSSAPAWASNPSTSNQSSASASPAPSMPTHRSKRLTCKPNP